MRVRALNSDKDWTFGNGRGNYRLANDAIAQNIHTRLNSFLGDCFFDMDAGLDWYNLLGYKDTTAVKLAISTVILNTEGVTGLRQLSLNLDRTTRRLSITYKVQTSYSAINDIYTSVVGI